MRLACSLVLLLAACGADNARLDALFGGKLQETQKLLNGVENQLSAARQVAELFALETEQRELLALETRAKMEAVRADVKKEMENALKEVEELRHVAVKNATMWRQTLKGLQDASERNRQTLKQLKDQREVERQKQLQKEEMERQEKEMELQRAEEEQMKVKMERQREIEKKLEEERKLERQREVEKKLEEQKKKREEEKRDKLIKEKRSVDAVKRGDGEETRSSSGEGRVGTVKQLLAWYVTMEQRAWSAAATFYRQLVVPVVAILSFFLVMTVAIAKYNAMKLAQRNKRVLYSGYPKSYRRKAKQETNPVLADDMELRPRRRQEVLRRGPDGLFES